MFDWSKVKHISGDYEQFSMREFGEKYNKMNDEEWAKLIKKAARKGYDISNVTEYRKQYGENFNVMNFFDVFQKLLWMNGYDYRSIEPLGYIPTKEESLAQLRASYLKYGIDIFEKKNQL